MEKINIVLKGVSYDLDLDTLGSKVKFGALKGRKFELSGKNKQGEEEKHKFSLNQIMNAILSKPEIDGEKATEIAKKYKILKRAGYNTVPRKLFGISKGIFNAYSAAAFKPFVPGAGTGRARIDGMMLGRQHGLGKMMDDPSTLKYEELLKFRRLHKGKPGAKQIIELVVTQAIQKSKTGDAQLNLELAKCYHGGLGVRRDFIKALEICSKYHDTNPKKFDSLANDIFEYEIKMLHMGKQYSLSDLWRLQKIIEKEHRKK